jgi:hypothetical protein
VRAQARGAIVQVSIGGGQGVPAAGSAARVQFDQLQAKKVCPATTGCISSNPGAAHTKAWTFSRTTYPGDTSTTAYVVWAGSYNMTNGPDGNAGFNNSATLYGNQSLYNFVRDYLGECLCLARTHQRPGGPAHRRRRLDAGRGLYRARHQSAPHRRSPGGDPATRQDEEWRLHRGGHRLHRLAQRQPGQPDGG